VYIKTAINWTKQDHVYENRKSMAKQRGYTNAAVQHEVDMLAQMPRPKAPADYRLNADEIAEWNRVVGALPPNWFAAEAYGLLAEYVSAVVESRVFREMARETRKKKDYPLAWKLSQEQRAITDQVKKLAITLRIVSRANGTTKVKAAKIRRDIERIMPTIQHDRPWNEHGLPHGYVGKEQTPTNSPWVNGGAIQEAAE
jgi:hypothetical protein